MSAKSLHAIAGHLQIETSAIGIQAGFGESLYL
jgi:hypothetical protein